MNIYTKVRKLENISNVQIQVQVAPFTSIYLKPGDILRNKTIYNLSALNEYVNVEYDLAEITPISGRVYLCD